MKSVALIWKESIYKNNFICPKCGKLLFDVIKNTPTDNTGFKPDDDNTLYCMECKEPVAVLKDFDNPDGLTGLAGKWQGD